MLFLKSCLIACLILLIFAKLWKIDFRVKKGVRIELIAALLGHSADVCRSTYIHFIEEQKKAAVELIDDYEVDFTEEN